MSSHLEELRAALQDYVPQDGENHGVLTGYVVVAQWSDADGEEWLTYTAGNINDIPPAIWFVKGWLAHTQDILAREQEDDEVDE